MVFSETTREHRGFGGNFWSWLHIFRSSFSLIEVRKSPGVVCRMGDIFWTANWSVKFLETSYGSGVGHFDSANSGFASVKKGKLRDSSIVGKWFNPNFLLLDIFSHQSKSHKIPKICRLTPQFFVTKCALAEVAQGWEFYILGQIKKFGITKNPDLRIFIPGDWGIFRILEFLSRKLGIFQNLRIFIPGIGNFCDFWFPGFLRWGFSVGFMIKFILNQF